jgi:predicted nucleotide-binding protein
MFEPEIQRWTENAETGIRENKPSYVLSSSKKLKSLNRADLAEKILKEAIVVFDDNIPLFRELSDTISERDPNEGLNFANDNINKFGNHAIFQRAIALSKLGRNLEAIQDIEDIVRLDNEFKKDRFVISKVVSLYNDQGLFEKARNLLEPLIDDGIFTDFRMKQLLATILVKERKSPSKVLELLKDFNDPRSVSLKREANEIIGILEIHPETKQEIELSTANVNKVFVVHGRNEKAREAMFVFLRSLGLEPIEWTEAIAYTRTGAPYIGEILDRAFSVAQAVVVLITGDDIAKLCSHFLKESDPGYERTFMLQARPNVLFEAGLAFGRHQERTILVELGSTRPFSDIAGRHMVRISNDAGARQDLVTRLKNAGCTVKIEGKVDWLTAGNFDEALKSHAESIENEIQNLQISSDDKVITLHDRSQIEILLFIAKKGDTGFTAKELSTQFNIHIVKLEYYLDLLVRNEYLYTLSLFDGTLIFKLTQKGRTYVVKNLNTL